MLTAERARLSIHFLTDRLLFNRGVDRGIERGNRARDVFMKYTKALDRRAVD
jgi:hypothetical protein